MHTSINISNPDNLDFRLKETFTYPPKPAVNVSTRELLRPTCHDVSDEQMVVAYMLGMTERMTLIHQRSDGDPFISLVVAIPGVEVTYFWKPSEIDSDDAEGLIRALAELLVDSGEFLTVAAARSDIERRTGLTSAAGGEG